MWPSVVPSLDSIKYNEGSWPVAGKTRVQLDPARDDLGNEGFQLDISPHEAVVTAATQAGADYGEGALASLIKQTITGGGDALACGSATSVPFYAERGVTLSASTLTYSEEFIDQLLALMSRLRLNQLLLEVNLGDAVGDTPQWPYWTKPEVAYIVERARAHHIEVIPQVNAPSHMETFLRHAPQYALLRDGRPDLDRLDFTRADSVDFYMEIVDSYSEVFDSKWWHMGADEFEHNDITFDSFPQLSEKAREILGEGAGPRELYIRFINEVAARLRSRGKRLRVWNDSLRPTRVKLDPDIVVEYWQDAGLRPEEHLENGHEVVNVSEHLYWSRSEVAFMDPKDKYESRSVDAFATGWQGSRPGIRGLRASIWPDRAWMQTENEVIDEVGLGIALVAQNAWSHSYPWSTWEDAREHLLSGLPTRASSDYCGLVGHKLEIPALSSLGQTWEFLPTPDGYARIRNEESGKFLSLRSGKKLLGVVMGEGSSLELAEDIDPQLVEQAAATRHTFPEPPKPEGHQPWNLTIREVERPLYEYNCQKWQVLAPDLASKLEVHARGVSEETDCVVANTAGEPAPQQSNIQQVNSNSNCRRVVLRAALSQLEITETDTGATPLVPRGNSLELLLK